MESIVYFALEYFFYLHCLSILLKVFTMVKVCLNNCIKIEKRKRETETKSKLFKFIRLSQIGYIDSDLIKMRAMVSTCNVLHILSISV